MPATKCDCAQEPCSKYPQLNYVLRARHRPSTTPLVLGRISDLDCMVAWFVTIRLKSPVEMAGVALQVLPGGMCTFGGRHDCLTTGGSFGPKPPPPNY